MWADGLKQPRNLDCISLSSGSLSVGSHMFISESSSEAITSGRCIFQAAVKTLKPSIAALRRQISGEWPFHWMEVRLVKCASCLFKDEPVVFPPLKSHTLPSADAVRLVLRDCLGYSPFSPHTVSLEATCSPVYLPTTNTIRRILFLISPSGSFFQSSLD